MKISGCLCNDGLCDECSTMQCEIATLEADAKRWQFARDNGLIWADKVFPTGDTSGFAHGRGTATPGRVGDTVADNFINWRMNVVTVPPTMAGPDSYHDDASPPPQG